MSPLRSKMIDAMRQRGFSVRTHESYLGAVEGLAQYYHRSPENIDLDDIQNYFAYLVKERDLSGASCRLYLNGVRFLYLNVLNWPHFDVPIIIPKRPQRIPELLTHAEVHELIGSVSNVKHRHLLLTCYGCGLRVSELVSLKVRDIDGERHLLRIDQGKGGKDRLVILSHGLHQALRRYWQVYRPSLWLFANNLDPMRALHVQTAQRVYTQAKARANINKRGGIHALRHAYATLQLEAGMPVHQLRHMLGHSDIRSTLRYVHWVHNYREGREAVVDLVAPLEAQNRDDDE